MWQLSLDQNKFLTLNSALPHGEVDTALFGMPTGWFQDLPGKEHTQSVGMIDYIPQYIYK